MITPEIFPSGRFGPLLLDKTPDSANNSYFSGFYKRTVQKIVDLRTITDSDLEKVKNEVMVVCRLCHPNILPIISANVNATHLHISMPFAEHGSCRFILDKHFDYGFKEDLIKHVLTSVLSAVYYLSINMIVHTRICSRNVLLTAQGHVYLTGFEYAQCTRDTKGVLHTFPEDIVQYLPWTAPEILAQTTLGYSYPADIYSVGALGVELNNGVPPFTDATTNLEPALVLLEKLKGFTPRLLDSTTLKNMSGDRPESNTEDSDVDMMAFKQRTLSPDFHQLIEFCCRPNPFSRPTAEQVLKGCPFTNPIEQKRNSGSSAILSQLPIAVVNLDEEDQYYDSPISVATTTAIGQSPPFETIEEENESQLSSQPNVLKIADTEAASINSETMPKHLYWEF